MAIHCRFPFSEIETASHAQKETRREDLKPAAATEESRVFAPVDAGADHLRNCHDYTPPEAVAVAGTRIASLAAWTARTMLP